MPSFTDGVDAGSGACRVCGRAGGAGARALARVRAARARAAGRRGQRRAEGWVVVVLVLVLWCFEKIRGYGV